MRARLWPFLIVLLLGLSSVALPVQFAQVCRMTGLSHCCCGQPADAGCCHLVAAPERDDRAVAPACAFAPAVLTAPAPRAPAAPVVDIALRDTPAGRTAPRAPPPESHPGRAPPALS